MREFFMRHEGKFFTTLVVLGCVVFASLLGAILVDNRFAFGAIAVVPAFGISVCGILYGREF